MPPGKTLPKVLITLPQAGGDYASPRQHFFENLFPARRMRRLWSSLKMILKIMIIVKFSNIQVTNDQMLPKKTQCTYQMKLNNTISVKTVLLTA